MNRTPISTHDPSCRKTVEAQGSTLAYVDSGAGDPIVFLHGNPTFSYIWRNVIPHLTGEGRCLAPDLIGMGHSGRSTTGSYRFTDHRSHLDAWFDALSLDENVTLVLHDWGSALGFHWAHRHPEAIKAIAYMEAIVRPLTWEQWPEALRPVFQAMRSSAGDEMVLKNNLFVEGLLPGAVIRELSEEEMSAYRWPYREEGESRRPTLSWPREIPIAGEPADVTAIVEGYGEWLETADVPKLFINANPGTILTGEQRDHCRAWPFQKEITVPGIHYLQEDSADPIGRALVAFVREANEARRR